MSFKVKQQHEAIRLICIIYRKQLLYRYAAPLNNQNEARCLKEQQKEIVLYHNSCKLFGTVQSKYSTMCQ